MASGWTQSMEDTIRLMEAYEEGLKKENQRADKEFGINKEKNLEGVKWKLNPAHAVEVNNAAVEAVNRPDHYFKDAKAEDYMPIPSGYSSKEEASMAMWVDLLSPDENRGTQEEKWARIQKRQQEAEKDYQQNQKNLTKKWDAAVVVKNDPALRDHD